MSFIKQLNLNLLASLLLLASLFVSASLMIISESHGESDDSINATNQLEIDIHYEPLNVRTKEFMKFQTPVLTRIAQLVSSLRLIPYGRTYAVSDQEFRCPNNDQNCTTLKHHACILELYNADSTNIQEAAGFLNCAFLSEDKWLDVPSITEECFNQSFVDANWTEIEECERNGAADNYLNSYERIVAPLNPPLAYTPWIIVNDVYDSSAEINLLQELCDSYIPENNTQCSPEKLKTVVINYETMNSSVSSYFAEQIYPKIQYLSSIADFEFKPYGLTQWNGSHYYCSQGDDQCVANKIHACVIKHYYTDESERTIDFMVCSLNTTTSNDDIIEITRECFDELFNDDNWPIIENCSAGEEGDAITAQLADDTALLNPTIDNVPWITIDGIFSDSSSVNLVDSVCDDYWPIQPSICDTITSDDETSIRIAFYYDSQDQRAKQFAIKQLKQLYPDTDDIDSQSIQSMITLELIPWGSTSYSVNEFEVIFSCANGYSECYDNRLHACALNKYSDTKSAQLQAILFVLCTFEHRLWRFDTRSAGESCAQKIWPSVSNFEEIDECATNHSDVYLNMWLKTYEYLSDQSPNQRFPWITINGEMSEEAEHHLLRVVCGLIQVSKPDICFDVEASTEQTTEYTTQLTTEFTEMSTDSSDIYSSTETDSTSPDTPPDTQPNTPSEPKKLSALSISLISISSVIIAALIVALIVLGVKAYRRKVVPTSYRVMDESNGTEMGSIETVTAISVTPNTSEWVFQKTQL